MEYKNLPDLKGWAALRAVVERGGVSAAAQALNIGQPAVTKRLRALEECYGMPLTERVGARLRLTESGQKVYLLTVQTLDRQVSLVQELQNLARGTTAVRLEVTFAIGEHFLPGLLLRFAERHPRYKVDSRLAYGREIQAHLAAESVDVGLLENAPDHPDLMVQKWMDDELWMVCGPMHQLAQEDVIESDVLPELSYVLREHGAAARQDLDNALARIGISELDVVLEVGSTDTLVDVLVPSLHVSFLPRFAVEEKVEAGKLHRIQVRGFHIGRTLWIARHRDNLHHQVANAFIAMLQEK